MWTQISVNRMFGCLTVFLTKRVLWFFHIYRVPCCELWCTVTANLCQLLQNSSVFYLIFRFNVQNCYRGETTLNQCRPFMDFI